MISVIISYYKVENFRAVHQNIAETCGQNVEVIGIYNANNYSIGQAYNMGRRKAKYPFLLFLHDDVAFRTFNWGSTLINHLEDKKTGVVGIAGANYVPKAPSGWYIAPATENTTSENKREAIVLDGVFLAITANNFDRLHFDANIPGFHGYDTDFSLRASLILQNYIISDIKIDHYSSGTIDKTWLDNTVLIRKKLRNYPQKKSDITLEKIAFLSFIGYFFKYYPMNIKNYRETIQFLPKGLSLKDYFEIHILYAKFLKNRFLYRQFST